MVKKGDDMSLGHDIEEYLEKLWYMKEEGTDLMEDFKKDVGESFDMGIVDKLVSEGMVVLAEGSTRVELTQKGEDTSRRLIRAHRLAERLIHDALGGDFESGACEFEHVVTPELVESICTLLGHPRECPHGRTIPEGGCCKRVARSARRSVVPLTDLKIGQEARIAYVNCKDDRRLHRLDGLHLRPGQTIKLHQTYPAFVVECEGANIALDQEIVADICVWRDPRLSKAGNRGSPPSESAGDQACGKRNKKGRGRGWGRAFRFRDSNK